MVFVVIAAVLLGGVILAGGGHTISGLGKDIQQTSERVHTKAAE